MTKQHFIFYTALLFLSGLFAGCQNFFNKTVDVDTEIKQPEIVIHAFCEADSIFSVSISRTKPVFNSAVKDYYLADARVFIEHKGEEYELKFEKNTDDSSYPYSSSLQHSVYTNNSQKFVSGETYKVRVTHQNKTASSVLTVPLQVPDYSIYVDSIYYPEGSSNSGSSSEHTDYYINGEITPLPGDDYYYYYTTQIGSRYYTYQPGKGYFYDTVWYNSSYSQMEERLTSSTDLVNGKIKFRDQFTSAYSSNDTKTKGLVRVVLYKVNKHYYDFTTSLMANTYGGHDPFSEPVQIYSNVSGGRGIAVGFKTRTKAVNWYY